MFFGKISFTAPDKVPKTTNAMKKPNANQNMVTEPIESYRNRIPMRSWAEDDIPGNKLLLKGTHALSDSELLSIVIGIGIQGQNSLDIAQSLLSNCNNNLSELWKLGVTELTWHRRASVSQRSSLEVLKFTCMVEPVGL